VSTGLEVLSELMESERAELCGPIHDKNPDREEVRDGTAPVFGGVGKPEGADPASPGRLRRQCCVAALVICADGTEVPVGLRQGDSENAAVVKALVADLQAAFSHSGRDQGLANARALATEVGKFWPDAGGVDPRRPRADVHRPLSRRRRDLDADIDVDPPRRVGDLDRPDHPGRRQPVV
jgi:hypothetical protein